MNFSQASESFKAANPHIFAEGGDAPYRLESEATKLQTASSAAPTVQSAGAAKYEAKLESELQNQIAGFLERNNIVVIRSRMDKKTGTPIGTPDLLFAVKMRPIAWEIKMPGRKLTDAQERMMLRMTGNGWACFIIHSYVEAVLIFREIST